MADIIRKYYCYECKCFVIPIVVQPQFKVFVSCPDCEHPICVYADKGERCMTDTIQHNSIKDVLCPNCDHPYFTIRKILSQGIELIAIQCLNCGKHHPLVEMERRVGI